MVSHFILGAVTAAVNDGNALAGGSAAVAGEAAAHYIIKNLSKEKYPGAIDPKTGEIDPNKLPEDAKALVRDLSGAIAAATGGIAGDSAASAQLGGVVGVNAVENNHFYNDKLTAAENDELLRKEAVNIYPDDEQAQTVYLRSFYKGHALGSEKALKDVVDISGIANLFHLGMSAIKDPEGTFKHLSSEGKRQWQEIKELQEYAKNDPALLGELNGAISGYLEAAPILNKATGIIATGSTLAHVADKIKALKTTNTITGKAHNVGKTISSNWPEANLNEAIKKFAGENPNITITKIGKRIYTNVFIQIHTQECK